MVCTVKTAETPGLGAIMAKLLALHPVNVIPYGDRKDDFILGDKASTSPQRGI